MVKTRSSSPIDCSVLVNASGSYSLWPASTPLPAGWDVARRGSRLDCVAWVDCQTFERLDSSVGISLSETCVHELFEQCVRVSPDAAAVAWDAGVWSYSELNARANTMARGLMARGVDVGARVGLLMDASPELLVSILAVLKIGAAYVPLRGTSERTGYVVRDSQPELIVARTSPDGADHSWSNCIAYQDLRAAGSVDNLQVSVSSQRRAVIIYTSGSTGTPKGIEISHDAIVHRFCHGYPHRPNDCQRAPIDTVGHFSDLLMPLSIGSTVLLPGIERCADMRKMIKWLWEHGTTRLVMIPSHLRTVLSGPRKSLRWLEKIDTLIVSGEPATPALVATCAERMPWARLISGYGTSEVAGIVSMKEVTGSPSITVGGPCPGTELYILNENMAPVDNGQAGELYVGGSQLAIGYYRRPGLTAERFVANPFTGVGTRMLRTGDVARLTPDGTEILGRSDEQVKIRGYLVHANEVETSLERALSSQIAVVPRHHGDQLSLIAYCVNSEEHPLRTSAVRARAQAALPSFMVPSEFIIVDKLPMLSNGKVDRRLLIERGRSSSTDTPVLGLSTPIEAAVAELWTSLLDTHTLNGTDRFIDVGGDSLLALRMVLHIEETFGVEIALEDVLSSLTLAELASRIEVERAALGRID